MAAPTFVIWGWLGRADQTTKVKWMLVHPEQVAAIARHPSLGRLRLVVGREGEQDLDGVEGREAASRASRKRSMTLQDAVPMGRVEVAPGALPNDGKVIADERSWRPVASTSPGSGSGSTAPTW
ncbi:MAG: hypothetical protein R3E48_23250 [Burkholderiaceae bacterium]